MEYYEYVDHGAPSHRGSRLASNAETVAYVVVTMAHGVRCACVGQQTCIACCIVVDMYGPESQCCTERGTIMPYYGFTRPNVTR